MILEKDRIVKTRTVHCCKVCNRQLSSQTIMRYLSFKTRNRSIRFWICQECDRLLQAINWGNDYEKLSQLNVNSFSEIRKLFKQNQSIKGSSMTNETKCLERIRKIRSGEESINLVDFLLAVAEVDAGVFLASYALVSSNLTKRVLQELKEKGKIPAIKLYREATGASLKTAKDAVEEIMKKNDIEFSPFQA